MNGSLVDLGYWKKFLYLQLTTHLIQISKIGWVYFNHTKNFFFQKVSVDYEIQYLNLLKFQSMCCKTTKNVNFKTTKSAPPNFAPKIARSAKTLRKNPDESRKKVTTSFQKLWLNKDNCKHNWNLLLRRRIPTLWTGIIVPRMFINFWTFSQPYAPYFRPYVY